MWQSDGPELRSGAQYMDETLPVPRANFRAIGDADQVGVGINSEFAIELFSRLNDERND